MPLTSTVIEFLVSPTASTRPQGCRWPSSLDQKIAALSGGNISARARLCQAELQGATRGSEMGGAWRRLLLRQCTRNARVARTAAPTTPPTIPPAKGKLSQVCKGADAHFLLSRGGQLSDSSHQLHAKGDAKLDLDMTAQCSAFLGLVGTVHAL